MINQWNKLIKALLSMEIPQKTVPSEKKLLKPAWLTGKTIVRKLFMIKP